VDIGTLSHTEHNDQHITIRYKTIIAEKTIGKLTVEQYEMSNITLAIPAPKTGESPAEEVTPAANSNFTAGPVNWISPPAVFIANTQYAATVALTVKSNDYKFGDDVKINIAGCEIATAESNNGSVLEIKCVFLKTGAATLTDIEITTPPEDLRLIYTSGEFLDLSNLEAMLKYNDGSEKSATFEDFTISPANGAKLLVANNEKPVQISIGNVTTTAGILTVNPIIIESASVSMENPVAGYPSSTVIAEPSIGSNFTASIGEWSPALTNDRFAEMQSYSITVTLKANTEYAFASSARAEANEIEIEEPTVSRDGSTLAFTYTFPATEIIPKIVATELVVVNDSLLTPNDRQFKYYSACGEDDANISVLQEAAFVSINEMPGNSHIAKLEAGNNEFSINITLPGKEMQDYMLTINKPINDIIKMRWGNTLTVINNEKYHNYNFTSYKWYRNGREVGTGQSWSAGPNGEQIHPQDRFYVEATTRDGNIIRSCEAYFAAANSEYGISLKRGSANHFEIELVVPEASQIEEVLIYNFSGNLVSKTKDNLIDIKNISSGLYFVIAKAKGESGAVYKYSTKLVVN
jgi:hypothetical protein